MSHSIAKIFGLTIRVPVVLRREIVRLWSRTLQRPAKIPNGYLSGLETDEVRSPSKCFLNEANEIIFFETTSDIHDPKQIIAMLKANDQLVVATDQIDIWTSVSHNRLFFLGQNNGEISIAEARSFLTRILVSSSELSWIHESIGQKRLSQDSEHTELHQRENSSLTKTYIWKKGQSPSVNLVDYESSGWILSRVAAELRSSLLTLGVETTVSNQRSEVAQINHHIIYLGLRELNHSGTETTMVTHVDSKRKMNLIVRQAKAGILPIAMSSETSREVGAAIHPIIKGNSPYALLPPMVASYSRPYKFGIFSRIYSDGRKREFELLRFAKHFSQGHVEFLVVGPGWESIVKSLRKSGYSITWLEEFSSKEYTTLVDSVDCVLYFGWDEGAVGCLDALARGKRVIAPPVGYHLDYANPLLSFAFTGEEAASLVREEVRQHEVTRQMLSAASWTDYAQSHLEIWRWASSRPIS